LLILKILVKNNINPLMQQDVQYFLLSHLSPTQTNWMVRGLVSGWTEYNITSKFYRCIVINLSSLFKLTIEYITVILFRTGVAPGARGCAPSNPYRIYKKIYIVNEKCIL
jgi:hypothetical protein